MTTGQGDGGQVGQIIVSNGMDAPTYMAS
jgi:hypothetical protein